ncbi:MAG: amino acid ABC transporter substrate-binding protein [Nitrospiraceae bacterium]|nr:amino acid ABC transporter substrate-binding protein [Nitrospirota bacterium]MDA8340085.1 amino acid ABC transporter substrate-binding protein [Nitrospiraceae bacterium]
MKRLNLLVLLIIFLPCLLLKPANASEPIKIGLTLGLTGKYSEMSDMQMKGFRLWERDVNNKGGILGRKVQVIIYDDNSDSRIAKAFYEHLILRDKVDLVFGPYSSEITEAVLPVTEQYGYPVLAAGASADKLWQKSYRYVLGVYTPASKYVVGFLEMLVMNGFKDIAIVHADDSFSKDVASGAKKWAGRFGFNVLLFEGFKKGTKNLDDIAQKAKTSKAQTLIMCGHFDESVNMRLSLKNIGWYPKAYFASVGPTMQAFHERLGANADGVFSSSQWEHHGGLIPPGCHEFYDSYIKTYGEEPSYHAATAYAAGQILGTAVKKAESLDRDKIRDILSAMDTMTIIGRYGVDRTGMQIKHFNLITQWQNGKKEIVWPEELRTAKPVFK